MYCQRIQIGNINIIQNSLNNHINKIRETINTYEIECQKQLKILIEQQAKKIKDSNSQIDKWQERLQNESINLSSLENKCDNEIIYMTNMLSDQRRKLIKFKPNIDLDDISITLKLNDGNLGLLPEFLSSTSDFSL